MERANERLKGGKIISAKESNGSIKINFPDKEVTISSNDIPLYDTSNTSSKLVCYIGYGIDILNNTIFVEIGENQKIDDETRTDFLEDNQHDYVHRNDFYIECKRSIDDEETITVFFCKITSSDVPKDGYETEDADNELHFSIRKIQNITDP